MSRSRTHETVQDRMRRWHEYVQRSGPEYLPDQEPQPDPQPPQERAGLPVLHHSSVINRQQEKIHALEDAVLKEREQAVRLAQELARERSRPRPGPQRPARMAVPPHHEPYTEPPDLSFPVRRPSAARQWLYCLVVAILAVVFALLLTHTD